MRHAPGRRCRRSRAGQRPTEPKPPASSHSPANERACLAPFLDCRTARTEYSASEGPDERGRSLCNRVVSARVEPAVRTGGCLCGAVRYTVRGDPLHVRRCHCASCRKESGSAFTVYAHWPVEAFELSGEISSYDGRGFCPRCGSRVLDTSARDDGLIEIRTGSLDEAPFERRPDGGPWVSGPES